MMKRLVLCAGCAVAWALLPACSTAGRHGTAAPRVFLLDAQHLRLVRQMIRAGDTNYAPALARLEDDAREALSAGPFSVVNKKTTPPSGDRHDYMSQAPYFWPNPNTSNGLPYIRRDGEHNPDINKISDHRTLFEMSGAVETLALAWYFTGEEAFAAKAKELLAAWFFDPATRMNPHMEFAQAIPGVNTGRGIGLIEGRALAPVVDAVGLLAGSKAWTEADQRQLQEWYGRFLQWMQESQKGREEAAARNNHGTYYDIQAATYALFLGKTELASNLVQNAARKRIEAQIEPDGRQPLELARTRAWGYSVANLNGLMQLARLGENVGVDLWHYESADGRSIAKAIDYLLPFALGREKFPYQQLDGFSGRSFYPVLRRAAVKYPGGPYRALLAKIPPAGAAERSRLIRETAVAPAELHE
jgi:hypothetical protein